MAGREASWAERTYVSRVLHRLLVVQEAKVIRGERLDRDRFAIVPVLEDYRQASSGIGEDLKDPRLEEGQTGMSVVNSVA